MILSFNTPLPVSDVVYGAVFVGSVAAMSGGVVVIGGGLANGLTDLTVLTVL